MHVVHQQLQQVGVILAMCRPISIKPILLFRHSAVSPGPFNWPSYFELATGLPT